MVHGVSVCAPCFLNFFECTVFTVGMVLLLLLPTSSGSSMNQLTYQQKSLHLTTLNGSQWRSNLGIRYRLLWHIFCVRLESLKR